MMHSIIKCPICYSELQSDTYRGYAFCDKCKKRVVDISYDSVISSPLSNLFPHEFLFDGVKCKSMESFIQSLRIQDEDIQKYFCENYSGYMAYKARLSLHDWRCDGFVWWKGTKILRKSEEYQELFTRAYDALFQNIFFKYCLLRFKEYILIHSKGHYPENETLLTSSEYIGQLNRLINKL